MSSKISTIVVLVIFLGQMQALAQDFCVQIAAYNVHQPESFFKERGVEHYFESADKSGIYWYSAGKYSTREEAEIIQQDIIAKGFIHALIIDEGEQKALSEAGCPRIRDGVVFDKDPNFKPDEPTIYFAEGQYALTAKSKEVLDEVFRDIKQKPGYTLKIRGFTDGIGDGKDNMILAASRSRSARDYLILKGLRADRMFMEVFGEATPAAPNAEDDGSNAGKGRDLPENRKWNRRVTLKLEEPAKVPKPN